MTNWQWLGAGILALLTLAVLLTFIKFLRDDSTEDWQTPPRYWWDTDVAGGVGFILLSITIYAAVALAARQWEPW